jgi:hypothetical protein
VIEFRADAACAAGHAAVTSASPAQAATKPGVAATRGPAAYGPGVVCAALHGLAVLVWLWMRDSGALPPPALAPPRPAIIAAWLLLLAAALAVALAAWLQARQHRSLADPA